MDDTPAIEVPETIGEEIGGPGRAYFDDVVIDNILDALLELSAAVWTYHDRVTVLETVLAQKGIEVSDAIEAHAPGPEEIARREAERMALVNRVFGAFLRRPTPRGPNPFATPTETGDDA
jgi:hypothetical protein